MGTDTKPVVEEQKTVTPEQKQELFSQEPPESVGKDENSSENSEKVIFKGLTKEFKTQEELTDYTKDLEARLIASEAEKQQKIDDEKRVTVGEQTGEPEQKSVVTDEMADEIFENPKKVLTDLETKITQRTEKAKQQKDGENAFWETFYAENKDLQDKKRVVDLVLKEKQATIAPMSLDKGKEFLANEARNLIKDFGGSNGTTEKLGGGAPTTLGTSHITTDGAKEVAEKSDFVSEMQNFQSQR